MRMVLGFSAIMVAHSATADVTVQFRDGAPKDRFTIVSAAGVCAEGPVSLTIDLAGSAGRLIFDVTGSGGGVEVFQPFELVAGGDIVRSATEVADGDQVLTLGMAAMPPGAEVAFTIDLDDTIGQREITVTGSEIAGAEVRLSVGDQRAIGTFDAQGNARVAWPACLS